MPLCKRQSGLIRTNKQGFFSSLSKAADFSAKCLTIKNSQFAKCITFNHPISRIFGDFSQTPYAAAHEFTLSK